MPDAIGGLLAIGLLILWLYCIYDVITTDDVIINHLPKIVWLMIVVMIPDVGSLLWLGVGRPRVWTKRAHDPARYGVERNRQGRLPAVDPLNDPALEQMSPIVRHREEQARLHMWEAQLRRREEEFKRRLEGGGSPSE